MHVGFDMDGEIRTFDEKFDVIIHHESKEEMDRTVTELRNVNRWIPVREGLPRGTYSKGLSYESPNVLVTAVWGESWEPYEEWQPGVLVGYLDADLQWHTIDLELEPGTFKVIAWMRIPEPYEVVGDE